MQVLSRIFLSCGPYEIRVWFGESMNRERFQLSFSVNPARKPSIPPVGLFAASYIDIPRMPELFPDTTVGLDSSIPRSAPGRQDDCTRPDYAALSEFRKSVKPASLLQIN